MLPYVITEPTEEPVTETEVEEYLRLSSSDENDMIKEMISEARHFFEDHSSIVCLTQTLKQRITSSSHIQYLMKWPVQSVIVKYGTGAGTDYNSGNYTLHKNNPPAYIKFTDLPHLEDGQELWIEMVCGWLNPKLLPARIKRAIKLYCAQALSLRNEFTEDDLFVNNYGFAAAIRQYTLFQGDWNDAQCR